MAAVVPAAEKATELLQKLSLDAPPKTQDVPEPTKKLTNNDGVNTPIPSCDRSITPILQDFMDQSTCYFPNGYPSPTYYYGHYDGSMNNWDDYSRYLTPDGVDMPPHGVFGDMYHHGYGYAHYGAYPPGSPVPTIGHDGQYYGQHYQYPGPYYQAPTPPSSAPTATHPAASQGEIAIGVVADKPASIVESIKTNSNGADNVNTKANSGPVSFKSSQKNSSMPSNGNLAKGVLPNGLPTSGYQDPRFGYGGMRSPTPWIDGTAYPDAQHRLVTTASMPTTASNACNIPSSNQNFHAVPHLMGLHPTGPASGTTSPGYINRIYPNNRLYGQYGNSFRSGHGYGLNGYDSRTNMRGWLANDNKFNVRGRGNGFYGFGNENMEGLNELNRGPRSGRFKNGQKNLGPNVVIAVKGQALPISSNNEDSSVIPAKDNYNRDDFPESYTNAKFYVIKSYSEDDIHKSVKYNVWASTPNGNKKLDAAFQEAKEKSAGCPVFLFFSVNTSGQFVGVAEMVGPVDFDKTVDYWQQDKWNGCFSVKWHIVKDVPNSILKHLTLENNENKPVTNSRDTQEVMFEQGLQLLKIFKEHVCKTSILDDFGFYEMRQKTMQEKRAKQQFQKQVWEGKAVGLVSEKEKTLGNAKPKIHKPLETASVFNKETSQSGVGDHKQSDNCITTIAVEGPKFVKSVSEKWSIGNGTCNGAPNGLPNGVGNGVVNSS